jgi:hypothetical protein
MENSWFQLLKAMLISIIQMDLACLHQRHSQNTNLHFARQGKNLTTHKILFYFAKRKPTIYSLQKYEVNTPPKEFITYKMH